MDVDTAKIIQQRILLEPVGQANEIRPLLRTLKPHATEDLLTTNIRTLKHFFQSVLPSASSKPSTGQDETPELQFREWTRKQFSLYKSRLTDLILLSDSSSVKEVALIEIMAALTLEPNTEFDNSSFANVLRALCRVTDETEDDLLDFFITEFMSFADVRYYVLRGLPAVCKEDIVTAPRSAGGNSRRPLSSGADLDTTEGGTPVVYNVYRLLRAAGPVQEGLPLKSWCGALEADEVVPMKRKKGKRKRETEEGVESGNKGSLETGNGKRKARWAALRYQQKALTEAWLALLALPLPAELLKRVLVQLHSEVMPHMSDPHLLADFFAGVVDHGGLLGILGLHGLFTLVTKHKLEYPHFYKRLYSLLNARVFQAGYRIQFFQLMDVFLASSKVPAYTAAAFAKKFARLSLRVSPAGALIALGFIHNVLRRHPALRCLLDSAPPSQEGSSGEALPEEDVFREDEDDLTNTRAHESSLWEVQTLANHYCPQVARAASSLLEKDLTDRRKTAEVDCGGLLPSSYTSMVVGEARRRLKAVPTSYFKVLPTDLAAGCPVPHLIWR